MSVTATTTTNGRAQLPAARTLPAMLLRSTAGHDGAALRFHDGEAWTELSYADLGTAVREIAAGLAAIGIDPGDRVSILAETRPEWTLADLGALCAGAVVAPIYDTNSPEECRHVLAHAGSRVVFCSDATQAAKVARVRDECPALEHVVTFSGAVPDGARSLDDLRALGRQGNLALLEQTAATLSPDDPATIVYTSGTTGPPKGCVTTHGNVMATARMYKESLELSPGDPLVVFMFLPLAHSLARVTQFVVLDHGGTIAFWRRDPARLLDDLAATRPTHVPAVPRVFEKVRTKALAQAEDGGRLRRTAMRWALGVGQRVRAVEHRGGDVGGLLRREHALADRLVLSKVRGLFGPDLQLALTGAAPLAADVLDFFDACGVLVLEGYGMTETTAAGTLNTSAGFRFGTVGRPLPGTEVSIAADGEVLMRGPHVFKGYFKDAAATRETMTEDGWLRSGDLGSIDGDGFLSVTGRKKDLIITSSGKNVSAANIESALREIRWVSQAVVYGDGRPYLVALLTLDPDEAPVLAERLGLDGANVATLALATRVHDALEQEVARVNRRFARIEQVKRFAILDADLSQATGDLTPTQKVKRNVVYEKFADRFAALYDED